MIGLSLASVTLGINGPRVMGHATDLIFGALMAHRAIDFDALLGVLLAVLALYAGASLFAWAQGALLNVIVQRTVRRLRAQVEDKLNRLPLAYFDLHPRGELLSRVTNDIDNVGQSLQQTLSQILNGVLNLIGILIMFFVLSPLLALISLVSVPLSIFATAKIAGRAQKRFGAQWKHVGVLNAQIEEAFTGHALVKVFGQQRVVEERFGAKNEELYQTSFLRAGDLERDHAGDHVHRKPQLRRDRGGRRLARVASGAMLRFGSVQAFIQYSAAVQPAARADGVDGERAGSSRASRRRSACSSCSMSRISRPRSRRPRRSRRRCAARSCSSTWRSSTRRTRAADRGICR